MHKACSEYIIRRCRLTSLLAGMGGKRNTFYHASACYACTAIFTNLCVVCQSFCPSVCQSVSLSLCLSVCLSVCRAVCTSVCPSCYCVKMNGRAHCRTLSTFSYGRHSTLSSPIAVTKFRGKPLGVALNISGGIFFANIVLYVGM